MKIIKRGEVKKPWYGRWKCFDCGTIVEIGPGDDAEVRHFHAAESIRDDDSVTIECPVCDTQRQYSRHKGAIISTSSLTEDHG